MHILPLLICCLIPLVSSSKKSRQSPRLVIENGNVVFYAAYGKNIEFRTTPSAGVSINHMDLLSSLKGAHNATKLVKTYQNVLSSFENRIYLLERGVSASPVNLNNTADLSLVLLSIRSLNRSLTYLQAKVSNLESGLLQNECSSNPCQNGGTCVDMYYNYLCHCLDGWQGANCLEDVNECSRFQGTDLGCQNGATCINKPGTYECLCPLGFVGLHCTRREADCNSGGQELCGHGTCVSQNDHVGYKCICDQGWTTEGSSRACTRDVDECNLNSPACSKSPNVPCINVPGSYYCGACPTGYSGNGYYCADIDECEINNGGCSLNPKVACRNTQGSSICGPCPAGYDGDGVTCVFKGVCQVNNGGCHYLAQCRDNPRISPTYVQCVCPTGYVGNGIGPFGCTVSKPSNPCASRPCVNGNCTVNHNTVEYVCSCERKYTGRNCDIMRDPCNPNPCQNGGSCMNPIGIQFQCSCKTGFNGKLCETERQACGGTLFGATGVLEYPRGDYETYGHGISCSWTIETNSTKVLNITFSKFDIEASTRCQSDWLEIHDGPNSAAHPLGRFCGTDLPKGGKIISTHNIIYLWFSSNKGNARTGFKLTWNSLDPDCGKFIIPLSHGTIQSPGSPGNYPPNRDCYWTFSLKRGKRLLFDFFSLNIGNNSDCDHDFIEFIARFTWPTNTFAKFCNSTVPAPFYVTGPFIQVHFHSGNESSNPGFQMTYSVVETIPGCGGTYSEPEGTITSVQPDNGNSPLQCEYLIQRSSSTRFKIVWLSLDLPETVGCTDGFVEIREGVTSTSLLFQRYCGSILPSPSIFDGPITIISSTSASTSGWKIRYTNVCGMKFTSSSGSFTSPNSTRSANCFYNIEQPIGYIIELNVEVTCNYSAGDCRSLGYLDVRDGDHEGAPSLKKFEKSGSETLTSSHNHLVLEFEGTRWGFEFKASYTSTYLGCGGVLKERSGTITPGVSQPYSLKCSWLILAPPKHVIELTWAVFSLEKSYNCSRSSVRVFDNNTDLGTGQLMGRYCGSTVPEMSVTTGNIMTVVLLKNSTRTTTFQASYRFVHESRVCDTVYYTPSGILKSPGYPQNYSRDIYCTWKIVVSSGQQILLNVADFKLENSSNCIYDWLEIRHGSTSSSPLIGKYCGTIIPYQILSEANELYIVFKSDNSQTERGFKLIWSSASTECGGSLTSATGTITSPHYRESYSANTDCLWQISVASGSLVKISFTDIDLNPTPSCTREAQNYVELFDGLSINSESLGIFCTNGTNPVESTKNHVLVKFRSDIFMQGRGFKLNYVTLCKNTLKGFHGVITSPNFPYNYMGGLNCSWKIIVSNKNKINITFSQFELDDSLRNASETCNSNFGNLKIKYGSTADQESMAFLSRERMYCGKKNPGLVTVDSNVAVIDFVTFSTGRGFRLEWQLFGCGGVLRQNSGTIQSPNYPKPYPPNIECQWQIEVDYGYSIQIHFTDIDIESRRCYYDVIQIYNGLDNSAKTISRLCYQVKPTVVTSTGNQMFIDFQADSSDQGRGFVANYSTIPTKCGGKFTATEGIIYSPNYPKNFDENDTCYWLIEVGDSHSIDLRFEDVDLPKNCSQNYIKVYDGETEDYPVLQTVCETAPNQTIHSTFNKIYMVFSSNTKYTTKGFRVKYKQSCGSRIITEGSGEISVKYEEFPTFSSCAWTIVSKDPTRHVSFAISQMQIDNTFGLGNPTVTIFGGETTSSPVLKTFTEDKKEPLLVSGGSAITVLVHRKMSFFATYSILDSHCGGTLNLLKGSFSTPGYPDVYASDLQCEWRITVSPGNSISLNFHEFDLLESENCNTDFLEIRADNVSGPVLGIYCGKNKPRNTTHERSLWIMYKSGRLQSGTTVSAKGFYAQYEFNSDNELRGEKGVITSPLYPQILYKSLAFSWTIIVDPRRRILLTFKEFYVGYVHVQAQCFLANLKIYDGADRSASLRDTLCGVSNPEPITSRQSMLHIVLNVYFGSTGSNFLIEWLEVEKEEESNNSTEKSCGSSQIVDIGVNGSYSLMSPGYPHGYQPQLSCEWIFSTAQVNHLSIEIQDISFRDDTNVWYFDSNNCAYDYIIFYEKNSQDNDWKLVKTICERKEEERTFNFTNLVKVTFTSDDSNNGTGFNITVAPRCGGSMEGPAGYIYFNSTTLHGSSCEWNVTVRAGKTIEVTFVVMPLTIPWKSCDKYILLRNGKYPDSPLLGVGKYCFTERPQPLKTTGNHLNVKYVGPPTAKSFVLKYQEISVKCGGDIILTTLQDSTKINSVNYPNIPFPHSECSWTINAPTGKSLRIDFEERFDLTSSEGCEIEYVELRDGATELSPLIGRYCKEAPSTKFSTDNVLFVKFYTDAEEPRNGFKAKISLKDCGGTVRGTEGVIAYPLRHTKGRKKNCLWKIVGPQNHFLNIHFDKFNIANESTVSMSSRFRWMFRSLGRFNGSNVPAPLTSLGNEVIVNFRGTSEDNFLLRFHSSEMECGGYLKLESGTISGPSYLQKNLKRFCQWNIEVPEGRRVTLTFSTLYLNEIYQNLLIINEGFDIPEIHIAYLKSRPYGYKYESSSNRMQVTYYTTLMWFHSDLIADFSSDEPTICTGDFHGTSGVLAQPHIRNNSYLCRWTHTKENLLLNQTVALRISLNVNETNSRTIHRCVNSTWAVRVTDQEERDILAILCAHYLKNYVVRTPLPVTRVQAYTKIEMNFTISYETHQCGGIVNQQEGTLSSPNYPNQPNGSVECAWLVQADKEQTINLTVLSMDLGDDCSKSFLAIYNGNRPSHPRIGKYCGKNKPGVIISQDDSLWIEYRYEIGSAGSGFQLKYEAVSEGCGGIYHDTERLIQTPNYGTDYPNNAECFWEIRSDVGYSISLHFFDRFHMEESNNCTNDYVEVFDWKDDQWTSIMKKCGRDVPTNVQSTGDKLRVLFRSNDNITGNGFKAKWEWVCGGAFEAKDTPQTIISPGYPVFYKGGLNCSYEINPKSENLVLHFEDFELGTSSYDNVTIQSKNQDYYPQLKIYRGNLKPSDMRFGHTIVISFKTGTSTNKRGFRFTFSKESCGGNITKPTIINGPPRYTDLFLQFDRSFISCTWHITAPPKQVVILRILKSYFETGDGEVKVFNDLNEEGENRLIKLSGNFSDFEPIHADSGKMSVNLYSTTYYYHSFKADVYFSHGPAEGCGGTINLTDSKDITAPDLENLDCRWMITAPESYQIKFHFRQVNLPACADNTTQCSFIEVRDGGGPLSESIEKLNATANGKSEYRKFSTSLNFGYMRLVLAGRRSDTFRVTLTPVLSKCGHLTLNATKEIKTLTSPNYPNKYPDDIKCIWTINAGESSAKISLHFVTLNLTSSTDCLGDRVEIAEDPHTKIITEGLGPEALYETSPKTIYMSYNDYQVQHLFCNGDFVFDYYSSGNSLSVTFRSSSATQHGNGFKLEYSEVGCNRNYTSVQGRLYGNIYSSNSFNCVITITAAKNRTISLYFQKFVLYPSTNCTDAGFVVKDGGADGTLLTRDCGYAIPDPVFSHTNKLYIHIFNNTEPPHDMLYDVTYTSTDAGRGCGGELYNYMGRVSSPLYPQEFRNNTVCKWTITVPVGLYAALKFIEIDLQDTCDRAYVKVKTDSDTVHTICSNDNPEIIRSGSRIDIEYKSSEQNGGKGWLAAFQGLEYKDQQVY